MLDTFLKIAATPNWVTPTLSIIQTLWNRPSVGYNVPANTQWSTYAIQGLLKKFGVKVWGLALMDDMIIFRVRKAQAAYTQYLLERENIPYQGGLGKATKFLGASQKDSSTTCHTGLAR